MHKNSDGTIVLGDSSSWLSLDGKNGGIRSIGNDAGALAFHGRSLWRLVFADDGHGERVVSSADFGGFAVAELSDGCFELSWDPDSRCAAGVKVRIERRECQWHWRIEVANHTGGALAEIHFPVVDGIAPDSAGYLALPWQWGALIPDPVAEAGRDEFIPTASSGHERRPHWLAGEYPGLMAMQFMLCGNASCGMYFGMHDPDAAYKRFGMYGARGCADAAMLLKSYPESPVASGDSYRLPYPVVLGVYSGNWLDGAQIYRRWAVHQAWCSRGRTGERRDLPGWVADTPLWYWNWMEANDRGDLAEILPALEWLQRRLPGAPAFHWYGWNNQEHDSDYPDYRLEPRDRERLLQAVEAYHRRGIKVFPYINARLWNMDMPSWHQENAGEAACTVADPASGQLRRYYIEPYVNRPFIPMCPTTRLWQDKVIANVMRALDCGLDGAYLDQISSSFAIQCRNRRHGHHENGNYWYAGYREMMTRVRDAADRKRPEAIFTSESVIECFIGSFQLFLGYQCALPPHQLGENAAAIALFSAVYHDFIPLYGTGTRLRDESFYHGIALDIVGGVMPSLQGFHAEDADDPELRERLGLVLDWAAKFHCVSGRMLSSRLAGYGGTDGDSGGEPAVLYSIWEGTDGGEILVAVNHTRDSHRLQVPDRKWLEVMADGRRLPLLDAGAAMEIAAHSVRVLID